MILNEEDNIRIKMRKKLYSIISDLEQVRQFLNEIQFIDSEDEDNKFLHIEGSILLEIVLHLLTDEEDINNFFELSQNNYSIQELKKQLCMIIFEDAYSYSWFIEHMTGKISNNNLLKNGKIIINQSVINKFILYGKFINQELSSYIVTRMKNKGVINKLYEIDSDFKEEDQMIKELNLEEVILFEINSLISFNFGEYDNRPRSLSKIMPNLHRIWDNSDILITIGLVKKYLRDYYRFTISGIDCHISITNSNLEKLSCVFVETDDRLASRFKDDKFFSGLVISFIYEFNRKLEEGYFSLDDNVQSDELLININFLSNIKIIINILDKYKETPDSLFKYFQSNFPLVYIIYIGLNLNDYSSGNKISNENKSDIDEFTKSFLHNREFFFRQISEFYSKYNSDKPKILTFKI